MIQLIPAAVFLWGLGPIWRETGETDIEGAVRPQGLRQLQTVGYVICLLILCPDAWMTVDVVNARILEGLCLAVFMWAQAAKNRLWVRISGTMIVVIALYMTKGFWLSISWWVYLLAAGIGLIVFAAVNEKKK